MADTNNSVSNKEQQKVSSVQQNNSSTVVKKSVATSEVTNSTSLENKTKTPKKIAPKIGLYNRSDYNLHVVFKDKDILLPPKKRTTTIYNESDIVSVQDKSLVQAIASGIITILR